jgi:hypothetical protein
MPTTGAKRAAARGEVINLRASRRQKSLISPAIDPGTVMITIAEARQALKP